jgi:hypothetical protein
MIQIYIFANKACKLYLRYKYIYIYKFIFTIESINFTINSTIVKYKYVHTRRLAKNKTLLSKKKNSNNTMQCNPIIIIGKGDFVQ